MVTVLEWIGTIAGCLGVLVSIGGFSWTLIGVHEARTQARRAADASQASAAAVNTTIRNLAHNQVLIAIPTLSRISLDLELAAERGDGPRSQQLLHDWREASASLRALLHAVGGVSNGVFEELSRAAAGCSNAKVRLLEGTAVMDAVLPAIKLIGRAVEVTGDVGGQLLVAPAADIPGQ